MGFDDRLLHILLGCLIGFALGYIVRTLQEIREELSELDENVKHARFDQNSDGFLRYPVFANVLLFIVLVMTAWAAFASQRASNEVEAAQNEINIVSECNQLILEKTVEALNERTAYTRARADANADLQKAQAGALRILMAEPPRSEQEQDAAAQKYFDALVEFVQANRDAQITSAQNDYPTISDLSECLSDRRE